MTYDISMTPGGYMPVIHVSQGDENRLVTLRPIDAPDSGSYSIKGMRPDGSAVSDTVSLGSTGLINWYIDSAFTEIEGDCICEVVVTSGSGRIGSQNFILRVEKATQAVDAPEPWSNVTITENGTYNVRPYAEATVNVEGGGGGGGVHPAGTRQITENGNYDVTNYATAAVQVPGPSGVKQITENGTHDVAAFAAAQVNVPSSATGTKQITANGTYDVTSYAAAAVNVPSAGGAGAIADFITLYDSGDQGTLDLRDYPISVVRDRAFAATRYSDIRLDVRHLSIYAISSNTVLTTCTLHGVTEIMNSAFRGCSALAELHIKDITSVPTLGTNVFTGTPIASGTGKIYVPASMVSAFQGATNWSTYAAQIEAEP